MGGYLFFLAHAVFFRLQILPAHFTCSVEVWLSVAGCLLVANWHKNLSFPIPGIMALQSFLLRAGEAEHKSVCVISLRKGKVFDIACQLKVKQDFSTPALVSLLLLLSHLQYSYYKEISHKFIFFLLFNTSLGI